MRIHLALTDDWELRGNGSGDIEEIQFRAMRTLLDLYDSHGIKSTFNAEVMQQLTFRQLQDSYPHLEPLANAWDEHVRLAFTRGHDIQLHIHPQWSKVSFTNNRWTLSGDWSLLNYEPEQSYSMLSASKASSRKFWHHSGSKLSLPFVSLGLIRGRALCFPACNPLWVKRLY